MEVCAKKRLPAIDIRSTIVVLAVLLFALAYTDLLPFGSYIDDLAALGFGVLAVFGLFAGRYDKTQRRMLAVLIVIFLIGLVSNLVSGVVDHLSYILSDAFSFLKIFLVYFGAIALLKGRPGAVRRACRVLSVLAKVFILAAFFFGVLNYLGVVAMYDMVRFGIKNYYFYFGNASQFGVFLGCMLAFLIISGRSRLLYEGMALITLVLTIKGMSLIIVAVYLFMRWFVRNRLRWWHYVLGALILTMLLMYQIDTYLLDSEAPRSLLIKYGFITALTYFPFGAGFASFGSNEAAMHYSKLYYQYNFPARKAMTVFQTEKGTTTYLNDAYLGMIVGQFGIIGLLLSLYLFWGIGKGVMRCKPRDRKAKAIALACFVCFCGMAVMAGSVKGIPGEMLMLVFALYMASCAAEKEQARDEEKNVKDSLC